MDVAQSTPGGPEQPDVVPEKWRCLVRATLAGPGDFRKVNKMPESLKLPYRIYPDTTAVGVLCQPRGKVSRWDKTIFPR